MKPAKQVELANRIDFNKKMLSILRMGFEYGKDGYNEILVAEELEKLFTQAQQEAVEREQNRIIKEYGNSFNDGCGCCMQESLGEALQKEQE